MSDAWKEQLDVHMIEERTKEMYEDILPFYKMLHGFVRHRLNKFYGDEHVSKYGPIPAHLLGENGVEGVFRLS